MTEKSCSIRLRSTQRELKFVLRPSILRKYDENGLVLVVLVLFDRCSLMLEFKSRIEYGLQLERT